MDVVFAEYLQFWIPLHFIVRKMGILPLNGQIVIEALFLWERISLQRWHRAQFCELKRAS
jgi:hypothetical protein